MADNKLVTAKDRAVDLALYQELEQEMINQLDKSFIGNEDAKRLAVRCTATNNHMMMLGPPGVGKTRLIMSMGQTVEGAVASVQQFVSDLMPSDIIGTRPYNQLLAKYELDPGPLVGTIVEKDGKLYSTVNFFCPDEINRANPKMQSALLGAMQERYVKIGKNVIFLPKLFSMHATRNPIENKGTFDLPEAQLDRFMVEVYITYMTADNEKRLVLNPKILEADGHTLTKPATDVETMLKVQEFLRDKIFVSDEAADYIVRLVRATRPHCDEFIKNAGLEEGTRLKVAVEWGASPRAMQALTSLGKAGAAAAGRDYILPKDIKALAHLAIPHRIIKTPGAMKISSQKIVDDVVKAVTVNEDESRYKRR